MKSALLCVTSLITLALASGCGETTCQRTQRINQDLYEKASRGGCFAPNPPFIERDCETIVRGCSKDDLSHLTDAMDCFEKLQCEPGKESEYETSFDGCRPPLSSLSQDCPMANPTP